MLSAGATVPPEYEGPLCKTARKDLVSSFLMSRWPRCDLFLIAERIEEMEAIAKQLGKSEDGRSFAQDSLRDEAIPNRLRNELAVFFEHLKNY